MVNGAVAATGHSLIVELNSGSTASPAVSLLKIVIAWTVSYGPTFESLTAVGVPGLLTVTVISASVTWPVVSATTYFTGVAWPLNVDRGTNVTVPFAFTV